MKNPSSALAVDIGKPGQFVHVRAGDIALNGVFSKIASADLAVAANTTNYIFLNLSNLILQANTTGFPANTFPLATVVTDNVGPTTITTSRPDWLITLNGLTGNVTGANITGTGVVTGATLVETATLSPTSVATAGVTGQLAWDGAKLYVCTAGGIAGAATWRGVATTSV